MLTTQRPGLYILSNEAKQRCVYCAENIKEGSIIEVCPVIIINEKDTPLVHRTILHDYYFMWDLEVGSSAIALGYGSIYNHSNTPNAAFENVIESKEVRFYALKDIPAGTEIQTNYIGQKIDGVELWFEPVE